MDLDGFDYHTLSSLEPDERLASCNVLASRLSARLAQSADFENEVLRIVSDLCLVGHDLANYDQTPDWQIWGHDYVTKRPGAGLYIELARPSGAVVKWNPPKP